MSWFDGFGDVLASLFGDSSASSADALMGGTTDLGGAASSAGGYAPDLGQFAFDSAGGAADAGNGFDWGSLGGGIDGANPAAFGGGDTPFFNPNSVGPPPAGNATLGSVAPNQGGAVAGQSFGGGDTMTGAGGGDNTDPETFAQQGRATNSWNPSTQSPVQSGMAQQPPPTAWESLKQAPGKWWQNASTEYNRAPISNTLRLGFTAAPIAAAAMAPSTPKYRPLPSLAS